MVQALGNMGFSSDSQFFRVLLHFIVIIGAFPWGLLEGGRPGLSPWVGKIPWRRAWQPTPVLLPGEPHGQRSLAGYSLWGRKEWDTTERLSTAHSCYKVLVIISVLCNVSL